LIPPGKSWKPTQWHFLAALCGYSLGLKLYVSNSSQSGDKRGWLLVGMAAALGLGLCTDDPFHAAVLDFMPWTVLIATVAGTLVGKQRDMSRYATVATGL
jgi:hypothetical protein